MNETEVIEFIKGIAKHVMRHHDCCGLDLYDLVSTGWIAFEEMRAGYDPTRGSTLQAYCYDRVEGSMLDLIKAERPRGYRKYFKPGQDAPIKTVELDNIGEMPNIEEKMEFRHVNEILIKCLPKRSRIILIHRAAGVELRHLAKRFHRSPTRVYQIHRESQEIVKKVLVKRKRR